MSKERIIKKTADDLNLSEDIVHSVISSAFEEAFKAFWQNNQVEISGFGTFMISPAKLARKIPILEKAVEALDIKYNQLPTEENFKKRQEIREFKDDLIKRYEKVKGIPYGSDQRNASPGQNS